MKYALFAATVLMMLPLSFFMYLNKKIMRIVIFLLPTIILIFDKTALNFFSNELYRGSSRGIEISIIYLLALAILLVIWLKTLRISLPFKDIGIYLYLLFFLMGVFSMINADNLLFSCFELWKMSMMVIIFLAIWNYVSYTNDCETILYGIGLLIIINFFPIVLKEHLFGAYQKKGVFPHQNSMALFMTLMGPFFLAKMLRFKNNKELIFSTLAFFSAGGAVAFSYSRGGMIAFPLSCSITLFISFLYSDGKNRLKKALVISLCALIALSGVLRMAPRIIERFEEAPESSGQTRVDFAIAAVNMMKDQPLGVGINNWGIKVNPPYEYSKHREQMGYDDDYKDGIVETVYLLAGAECGYFGLLFMLAWFFHYLVIAFKLLKRLKKHQLFFIPVGACGGLIGVYAQSCLEWVLRQQVNFIALVIVFALLSSIYYVQLPKIKKGII